jgi:hypothetical protein
MNIDEALVLISGYSIDWAERTLSFKRLQWRATRTRNKLENERKELSDFEDSCNLSES